MRDELPDRLRVTAEEYRPDTDRMWERVSAGMRETAPVRAEPVRTRWRVPHLAIATCATMVLLAGIVLFGNRLGPITTDPNGENPPPGAAGPSSETSGAESPTAEEPEHTRPDPVDEVDWLWTNGSINPGGNNYWSQSDLKFTNDRRLTELTIELRVLLADDVETTGSWTTSDDAFLAAEVIEADGYLTYRWTLKDGAVLEPGEYTLAGQYNHSDGVRSTDGDYYTFTAVTEGGEEGWLLGIFEP